MAGSKRHYWLRSDFDELMGLLPGGDLARPGSRDSSMSLVYPKSTKGAAAELKLRGLECDESVLAQLVEQGVIEPERGRALVSDQQGNVGTVPSERLVLWTKENIDDAAEWLYDNDRWSHWTHFCWVSNLRYGQAVKAHRYMSARYDLGFTTSFDALGVVTVVEPSEDPDDYARVQFYPKGAKVEVSV